MKNINKQAILIMAHNNLFTLLSLIEMLDSEYFDLYVHIDKKSSIKLADLNNKCQKSKLYVYKEIDIRWADYSQVTAELFLLSKAKKGNYKYYHLISGNDMPLKRAKDIFNYFDGSNNEFVHFSAKEMSKKKIDWIKYYHIFMKKLRNNYFYIILDKVFVFFQKILFINRLKNNYSYMTGANWFSITDKLAKYTLDQKDEIEKMFNNTRSPDEIFLQTIVENSSFKNNLYNKEYNDNYDSCKRFIEWDGTIPYVFRKKDYEELINSNMMFARKFDENVDREIIELLYNKLKS